MIWSELQFTLAGHRSQRTMITEQNCLQLKRPALAGRQGQLCVCVFDCIEQAMSEQTGGRLQSCSIGFCEVRKIAMTTSLLPQAHIPHKLSIPAQGHTERNLGIHHRAPWLLEVFEKHKAREATSSRGDSGQIHSTSSPRCHERPFEDFAERQIV